MQAFIKPLVGISIKAIHDSKSGTTCYKLVSSQFAPLQIVEQIHTTRYFAN